MSQVLTAQDTKGWQPTKPSGQVPPPKPANLGAQQTQHQTLRTEKR